MQRISTTNTVGGDPELAGEKGKAPYYGDEEESYAFQQSVLDSLQHVGSKVHDKVSSVPMFSSATGQVVVPLMSLAASATIGQGQVSGQITPGEEGREGAPSSGRRKFSPVVERILAVLRAVYSIYMRSKTFLTRVITINWGYSILFFMILFLLMLYPLINILWYLVIRTIVALSITLIIRGLHGYCVKLLARKSLPGSPISSSTPL